MLPGCFYLKMLISYFVSIDKSTNWKLLEIFKIIMRKGRVTQQDLYHLCLKKTDVLGSLNITGGGDF